MFFKPLANDCKNLDEFWIFYSKIWADINNRGVTITHREIPKNFIQNLGGVRYYRGWGSPFRKVFYFLNRGGLACPPFLYACHVSQSESRSMSSGLACVQSVQSVIIEALLQSMPFQDSKLPYL